MRILLILGFLAVFSLSAYSQPPSWEKLIEAQTNERTATFNRQESEMNLLMKIQDSTMERMGSGDHAKNLAELHIVEREKLLGRHSSERTKLAEFHQLERMGFKEKPKVDAPAT
jgi:hypothetical protein